MYMLALSCLALYLLLLFHCCWFDIHVLIYLLLKSDTIINQSATFNTKSIVTVSGKNYLPI